MHERNTLRSQFVSLLKAMKLNRVASKLYYNHIHGFASAGSELPEVVSKVLESAVADSPDDRIEYHEFGIFKGHTLLTAYKKLNELNPGQGFHCFGYDSFDGLPEPKGIDLPNAKDNPFYAGQYRCTRARVEHEMTHAGADWQKITLIEGYFNESLQQSIKKSLGMQRAHVILVDCDLYESSVDVFNFLEGLIGQNAILILDDFESFGKSEELGQKRAFLEFRQQHENQWQFEHWHDYGSYGSVYKLTARPH